MAKMRAGQGRGRMGPLEPVERDTPEPGREEVRIETCGICHGDSYSREACFRALIRADRIDAADTS